MIIAVAIGMNKLTGVWRIRTCEEKSHSLNKI